MVRSQAPYKERKRTMKLKTILSVLSVLSMIGSFFFILGTAGASDCGMISTSETITRCFWAVLIMGVGFLYLRRVGVVNDR